MGKPSLKTRSNRLELIMLTLSLTMFNAALFGMSSLVRSSLPGGTGHALQGPALILLLTALAMCGTGAVVVVERRRGRPLARTVMWWNAGVVFGAFALVLMWTVFFPSRV